MMVRSEWQTGQPDLLLQESRPQQTQAQGPQQAQGLQTSQTDLRPSTCNIAHTLTDLQVGELGIIADITGERMQKMKLLDLGLTPGTEVCVQKIAPMGNPIQIGVRSYSLTLRKEEAMLVRISPAGQPADEQLAEQSNNEQPNAEQSVAPPPAAPAEGAAR